jgi:hypothetical protein
MQESTTTTPHLTRIDLVRRQSWKSTGKTRIIEMAVTCSTNTLYCNGKYKMQTQIKCLQINLQHSRVATANLMKIIEEDSTDILCTQEPYTIQNKIAGIPKKFKIFTSGEGRNRAAIVVTNNQIDTLLVKQLSHVYAVFVEVIIGKLNII